VALVVTFVGQWPLPLQQTAERVQAALQEELGSKIGASPGIVNIKLVDDAEIARLNKQYTGNAYATDVLTFPYTEQVSQVGLESGAEELADMVISVEMAARQARAAGTSLADEVGLLVLHGLLHALGYDHTTPDEQARLDQLQRRVMALAPINYREFEWKD